MRRKKDDLSRIDESSDRTGPARMTEDSRKSNQRDFNVFAELIRAFTSDRQSLPENAYDGGIFPRICDDEWVAESVALCGLKITTVIVPV